MGIFKKEKQRRSFVCGYCGRSIDKANEPDNKIIKKDGKPACAVCRATRFSLMHKKIALDKKKHDKDLLELEEKSRLKALEDVKEIAMASQENSKETKRISPKKFLK